MEFDVIQINKYDVLGGVEPEADDTSDEEMSKISKNPSDDLPNQEKNQYLPVYW